MKKTLAFVIAIAAVFALGACTSTARISKDSPICQSAKVNGSEPYNDNEMGPSHCPRDAK